jgi:cytochrome c peroxidase
MNNNAKKTSKLLIFGGLFFASLIITPLQAQEGPKGGGRGVPGNGDGNRDNRQPPPNNNLENVEERLQTLITEREIAPAESQALNLPHITDAKAQLGKQLFFAKNLGGEQSSACASCHHPMLGGGDDISLSVGVAAVNELEQSSHDLLGLGRFNGNALNNLPTVPRNSPTIFNLGFNNRGLFWDSRVETRRNGAILTPDSPVDDLGRRLSDPNLPQDATLAAAQARFPVTSPDEMRGDFSADADNQALRSALTARFNNSDSEFTSNWPNAFSQAFGDDEVSFNRISDAIGEYERSMVFINNPWQNYLNGDENALTPEQKSGAILFFGGQREGSVGCSGCHSGPTFSSNRHQLVAYPQFGPGKGNDSGSETSTDFGRENITHNEADRYHFRAPTLLNIAVTAPYGHAGAYQTLEEVIEHYNDPETAINRLFAAQNGLALTDDNAPFCRLPQIQELMQKSNQSCQNLYPDAYENSMAVVSHLQQALADEVDARAPLRPRRNFSSEQVTHLAAFLRALTDPCVENRACLAPWIIDENDKASFPDPLPLIAHDKNNTAL